MRVPFLSYGDRDMDAPHLAGAGRMSESGAPAVAVMRRRQRSNDIRVSHERGPLAGLPGAGRQRADILQVPRAPLRDPVAARNAAPRVVEIRLEPPGHAVFVAARPDADIQGP